MGKKIQHENKYASHNISQISEVQRKGARMRVQIWCMITKNSEGSQNV